MLISFLSFYLRSIAAWAFVKEWSKCSATCGGGEQTRTQSCVYSDNIDAEGQCTGNAGSESRSCNINVCRKLLRYKH